MRFDPSIYSISVRKESHDGETYFVGRVREFPNVEVFEDSFELAYSGVCEVLTSIKSIADSRDEQMPQPATSENEFSGRVTLRLPKALHKTLAEIADSEAVSLNQLLVSALGFYAGSRFAFVNTLDRLLPGMPRLTHQINEFVLPISPKPLEHMRFVNFGEAAFV